MLGLLRPGLQELLNRREVLASARALRRPHGTVKKFTLGLDHAKIRRFGRIDSKNWRLRVTPSRAFEKNAIIRLRCDFL
jgi:hypothetical protein